MFPSAVVVPGTRISAMPESVSDSGRRPIHPGRPASDRPPRVGPRDRSWLPRVRNRLLLPAPIDEPGVTTVGTAVGPAGRNCPPWHSVGRPLVVRSAPSGRSSRRCSTGPAEHLGPAPDRPATPPGLAWRTLPVESRSGDRYATRLRGRDSRPIRGTLTARGAPVGWCFVDRSVARVPARARAKKDKLPGLPAKPPSFVSSRSPSRGRPIVRSMPDRKRDRGSTPSSPSRRSAGGRPPRAYRRSDDDSRSQLRPHVARAGYRAAPTGPPGRCDAILTDPAGIVPTVSALIGAPTRTGRLRGITDRPLLK